MKEIHRCEYENKVVNINIEIDDQGSMWIYGGRQFLFELGVNFCPICGELLRKVEERVGI